MRTSPLPERCIVFYASSLDETQAELIAQAYYKSGKNPRKMAEALGTPTFDLELIRHPLVKRQILKMGERMRKSYSLEEHLSRLQEIRDAAMDAENFRIALASEIQIGKAAGLYERIAEPPATEDPDLGKLSTDEIKKRLAAAGGVGALPAPGSNLLEEDSEDF